MCYNLIEFDRIDTYTYRKINGRLKTKEKALTKESISHANMAK